LMYAIGWSSYERCAFLLACPVMGRPPFQGTLPLVWLNQSEAIRRNSRQNVVGEILFWSL
jgi:hypothetical protein